MGRVRLPGSGWAPRTYQLPAWNYLEGGGRHCELVWHRRSGKDEVCLHRTACAAFERIGGYWYMLPEYKQARKAVWDAINPHSGKKRIDEAFPIEIRAATRNQEMMIEFKNGSTFQVVGSDNPDSLVGSPPIGIVYSEWALSNPSTRAYLRPILLENGGWQIFNTTPRGRTHAYTTLKAAEKIMLAGGDAFAQVLDARDTGVFTDQQLTTELVAYVAEFGEDYGRAKFEQEYLCSFEAANMGAILARAIGIAEKQGRVSDAVEFDPYGQRFDITADIGRRDSATWWFWQSKIGGHSVFDYDGGWGLDAEEWCGRLQERIAKYQLADGSSALGTIWLPHDARAKTFAAKRSAVEIFVEAFGADHVAITPNSRISDRVNSARVLMPRVEFNATACEKGLNGLRAWSYEYDEEKKIFSSEPKHDWACFIAGTQVLTPQGPVNIEDMAGRSVVTPVGIRKVETLHQYRARKFVTIELADGRSVTCTPEHRIFTDCGLIPADALNYNHVLYSSEEWTWKSIAWILAASGTTDMHLAITDSFRQESSLDLASRVRYCIGIFGRQLMAQSLKVARYITRTMTRAITPWTTLNACHAANISGITDQRTDESQPLGIKQKQASNFTRRLQSANGKTTRPRGLNVFSQCFQWQEKPPKNGTPAPKDWLGTRSMEGKHGQSDRPTKRFVRFAVRLLLRIGRTKASIAGQIVELRHFDGDKPVYDLTIEQDHCYVAGGMLVSNSHDGDGFSYGTLIAQLAEPPKQPIEAMRGVTVGENTATLDELWQSTPKKKERL